MKSYGDLYYKFLSRENILLAIKNASKRKKKRKYVRMIIENPEQYVDYFRNYAMKFKNKKHKPREIYDGIQRKKRIIIVPTFDEQVVHHMLVNVLKPILLKPMYMHSYGSLPNKGSYKGMKTVKKWIKHGGKNIKYCFKCDIKKYFDSIPHDILKSKLRKIIKDEMFLNVLFEVIDVVPKGIPLGFYTSQWLSNWYLTELDHKIKEEFGAIYYIRYMDDIVMFGSNKRKLHKLKEKVERYINDKLGLVLKENWQIFRFDYGNRKGRPLDFMGYKFYRNRITLRKTILKKAKRKAFNIYWKNKITIFDARQMLSYMGWFSHTNTYKTYLNDIKPYVNIQYLKRKISYYDRRFEKIQVA